MILANRIFRFALCQWCLFAIGTTCLAAEPEAQLLAKLQDRNTSFLDKAAACKRLAVVGTEAAVPVLSTLLDDDKLAHYARYGLEPIPSEKVDQALIAALSTLEGKQLIGVIQSIGNRGKAEAVDAVASKLDSSDREVAKSAAHCLGRLGTPAAGKRLEERLSAEFAGAALVGAEQLARHGHREQAVALLLKILQQDDAAEHIRLAAMLHAVQLQGEKGLKLLAEALGSDEKKRRDMGLRVARLINTAAASKVARETLDGASPATRSLLVTLLGDLGDRRSLPLVIDASKSSDESIRTAALKAMANLGNAQHVALLLGAAKDPAEAISTAAMDTLVALAGDAVEQAILDRLQDEQLQDVAIEAVGKRRILAAVPRLVAMIDGPNQLRVVAALGETVSLDKLDVLGERLDAQPEELRLAVQKAFHAACGRMPNRSATVAKLVGYLDGASEVTVQLVMDELRMIGGPEALAAVANGANSDVQAQREYATRALGNWLDISAAPVLLELAQSEGESKYGIRGLRGYIRLARQFSMPEPERLKMCRTALQTAKRVEEKKLVLAVLERYPSIGALKIALEASKDASIKSPAQAAAFALAKRLKGQSAEVKALLGEAGLESPQ